MEPACFFLNVGCVFSWRVGGCSGIEHKYMFKSQWKGLVVFLIFSEKV